MSEHSTFGFEIHLKAVARVKDVGLDEAIAFLVDSANCIDLSSVEGLPENIVLTEASIDPEMGISLFERDGRAVPCAVEAGDADRETASLLKRLSRLTDDVEMVTGWVEGLHDRDSFLPEEGGRPYDDRGIRLTTLIGVQGHLHAALKLLEKSSEF